MERGGDYVGSVEEDQTQDRQDGEVRTRAQEGVVDPGAQED